VAVASGLVIVAIIAILVARRYLFPAVVLDSSRS
jgi:hypothetical protein